MSEKKGNNSSMPRIKVALTIGILFLSTLFASLYTSAGYQIGTQSSQQGGFPIDPAGSWNPNVLCASPWIVRISDITDNMTGSASFGNSTFSPGITAPPEFNAVSSRHFKNPIVDAEYDIVTASMTNFAVNYVLSKGSRWIMLGDALQGPSKSQLGIDGSAVRRITNSTTASLKLTTTQSDDMIIVLAGDKGGSSVSASIKDKAKLTWNLRASVSLGPNTMREYYATTSSSLSGDVIHVTLSGSYNIDLMAFGVSGANTGSPFDPNLASSPVTATGKSKLPAVAVTTSNANDLILGLVYAPGGVGVTLGSNYNVKRWLTPGDGTTHPPAGWVSPGPGCTIKNSQGNTVAVFVEIDGVKLVGPLGADCKTNYDPINGGSAFGTSVCDDTYNAYDPALVANYSTSCKTASDPTCWGRIHLEIDHDWQVAGYCGPATTCDGSNLTSIIQAHPNTVFDIQGFIFWDAKEIGSRNHSFSGWELHPFTAWKIDPQSLTAAAS